MTERRLYLHDGAHYRVRTNTGRETLCRWCDTEREFLTGRGTQRRTVNQGTIAAVKHILQTGQPRRWYALERCYRGIHAPYVRPVPWVHPIRQRMLEAAR